MLYVVMMMMMTIVEQLVEGMIVRETEVLGENLLQCRSGRYRSHN
jgi:hypothetical protein